MANFGKGPGDTRNGWDAPNSIQVVPLTSPKPTTLQLEYGSGLDLKLLDDNGKPMDLASDTAVVEVTQGNPDQSPRPIKIVGKSLGSRRLAAYLPENPPRLWTEPLKLYVVNDEYGRVFDGKAPAADLKKSLNGGGPNGPSLLEAVVRIAEDQMNSGTYRQPGGKSSDAPGGSAWWRCVDLYHGAREKASNGQVEAGANNWCGWFVQWCYAEAARVTGKSNPYPKGDYLASGLKAATWAMASPDLLILNWANPTGAPLHDPTYWGVQGQFPNWEFKPGQLPKRLADKTPNAVPLVTPSQQTLKPGDVCLVRDEVNPNRLDLGWKHVAIVHDIDWGAGTFSTIDGNAGAVSGDSTKGFGLISINPGKRLDKIVDGAGTSTNACKFVFLHLKGA